METGLYIQVLGGFSVYDGARRLPEAQLKKAHRNSALVKLLAVTLGHRLHRDQVIDILWPDADLSAAANSFHQTLYGARRMLDPLASDCLRLEGGFLSLELGQEGSLRVDVDQFQSAAEAAKTSPGKAGPDLQAVQVAIDLYRGDLLPEDLYAEWLIERRESLRQTYQNLLLNLAQLHEERKEFEPAIEALQRLLGSDRSVEAAHHGLMRLYARAGKRTQAIHQYNMLKDILHKELAVEPSSETVRLYQEILAERFSDESRAEGGSVPANPAGTVLSQPVGSSIQSLHNLPRQLTSLVGREEEIAQIEKMVGERPLVTLTGPGGVGKTRLALAVAEKLLEAKAFPPDQDRKCFPDGIWLVELAPVSDPNLVRRTVAEVFGLSEEPGLTVEETLLRFLKSKQTMLVVDNCEHVIEACALLFLSMLQASPGLKILAASREPLGLLGEALLPVESLTVPASVTDNSLETIRKVKSVKLFVDRAKYRSPGFELTSHNAAAVVQIVRQLDGIPLAIELAASRVGGMDVNQIAERLGRMPYLLAGEQRGIPTRQRTLRATIDWSYQLLTEQEKRLLSRLSVFTNGWTLEAAEQVCSGGGLAEEDIAMLLGQLVHKSMVVTVFIPDCWLDEPLPGYAMRYRLLKTIHQYTQETLSASGTDAAVRDRHTDYFLQLAETIEPKLHTAERLDRTYQLHLEQDNLLKALSGALDGNPPPRAQDGARLATALS